MPHRTRRGCSRGTLLPLLAQVERNNIALFPLNWTIVHVIDDKSPLLKWDKECLKYYRLEVLTLIEGYDETFAQSVHASNSYTHEELVWNARFEMMYRTEAGTTLLELDRIDEHTLLEEE